MTSTDETPTAVLPAWADMTDLDKGAALLFLHKIDWEGIEYAMSHYPARYFDHPALTALGSRDACRHAISVEAGAERAGALRGDEYQRLYDGALAASHARWEAEDAARTAAAKAGQPS